MTTAAPLAPKPALGGWSRESLVIVVQRLRQLGPLALAPALHLGEFRSTARLLYPGLCCKSRFALVIENSAGYRRGFRVKM